MHNNDDMYGPNPTDSDYIGSDAAATEAEVLWDWFELGRITVVDGVVYVRLLRGFDGGCSNAEMEA